MTETTQSTLELRAAFGRFATGVTVVTTRTAHGEPIGVTVNSFSSVSLDPALLLFSIGKASASLPVFRSAQSFAVNILASDQQVLSRRFALSNSDKWSGVSYHWGAHGAPLLDDAIAWFECTPWATHEGGDHVIFVGHIARYHCGADKAPLLFYGGRYADLLTKDEVKP